MHKRIPPRGFDIHPNTAPITFRKLFKQHQVSYFSTNPRAHSDRPENILKSQWSHRFRYPLHTAFLKANKGRIKTFFDVGAANMLSAPTAIDAKRALGKNARVVAVDANNSHGSARKTIRRARVDEMIHLITEKPLGVQVDAIRFANVSPWMSRRDAMHSLKNIWLSLKPGGYLLGANSTTSGDREFVLQKVPVSATNRTGFVEIIFPQGFGVESEAHRIKREKANINAQKVYIKQIEPKLWK